MHRLADLARRAAGRARNEPAVVVAALLALADVGFGIDIDLSDVEQLRGQAQQVLTWLLGGTVVRQSVYSKRTHEDEVVDAASHRGE